jgi:hypothetical protein
VACLAATVEAGEWKQRQQEQQMEEPLDRLVAMLGEYGDVLEERLARVEAHARRQELLATSRLSMRPSQEQQLPYSPFRVTDTTGVELPNAGGHRWNDILIRGLCDGLRAARSCELPARLDPSTSEERDGVVEQVGDHHSG